MGAFFYCDFFFFNDPATTEIYTLSLHDALPISIAARIADVMALYARPLTPEERSQLQALANGNDRVRTRWAQIILLSSRRIGVPQIADTLAISAATVRARIKVFNAQGLSALDRNPAPGRPEKIPASLGDRFAALMREREPRDFGWSDTGWTLDLLVKVAELEGWVESISREGVRLALRKSKHSYRRLKTWAKQDTNPPKPDPHTPSPTES